MKTPSFWWHATPTLPARLLQPVAWVYGQMARWHGKARAQRATPLPVPVISIGNITVGGAGKTPLTQWVAEQLAAMGHQVAIVSRGYGGADTTTPQQVRPDLHTARQVGDEPLLLARHFENQAVTIWVGRHRPHAVHRAIQAGATVVVLDDAFQRQDVARTLNLLVINGALPPFGNGLCLPAGPLREPLAALTRAHAAVVLNAPENAPTITPLAILGTPTLHLTTVPTATSLEPLRNHRLLAFCGLGHPEKFYKTLTSAKLNILETHTFPDHHPYTATNLKALQTASQRLQAVRITTTKDATKLPPNFAYVLDITLSGPDATAVLGLLRTAAPR